jgi:hypothetical protein
MAPLAAGAWLLRRRQDRESAPSERRAWRWTLCDLFLAFLIVGLVALALRSVWHGDLYLVPGHFALTCGLLVALTLLAALGALTESPKTRCVALMLALILAASGIYGPNADGGMGLAYSFPIPPDPYCIPHRWALLITGQTAATAIVAVFSYLLGTATRCQRIAGRWVRGGLLLTVLAAVAAPLAVVWPLVLPPEDIVAPLARSETYDKVQAVGSKVPALRTPGFNPAPLIKETAAALAEPGNVWFDANDVRDRNLSLRFDPSLHYEHMLMGMLDFAAAQAESRGRSSECLELAILQWRLGRVLRRGGTFFDWYIGNRADQCGCGTITAAVDSLSDQECHQAMAELRESLADRPDVETVLAYDRYWFRAFHGWRNQLGVAARRLLGESSISPYWLVSVKDAEDLERRSLLRLRLLETRLAMELYRRAAGYWPGELQDLVPQYLPNLPGDPFARRPLVYRRQADGFRLYSVGPDALDDGGRFSNDPKRENLEGFDIDWEFDRRFLADSWPRRP